MSSFSVLSCSGDDNRQMERRRFLVIALSLLAAGPAWADGGGRRSRNDDDDDREEADRVLKDRSSGKVKPLSEIIRIVEAEVPGRIVETEFDEKDGVPVYEFYVLQSGGRRREVKVDARDGRIIEIDED